MLAVQWVCDIIQTVMGLTDDQIWIYNQKKPIPNSAGLFVVVGIVDAKPYAVNVRNLGVSKEVRSVHMRETIGIDLFSSDLSAATQVAQLVGSLNSTYSAQVQEQYGFKIASVPQAVNNTSELEGSAMLTRFTVTTVLLTAYEYDTTPIEYYNTFSLKTYSEEGQES